MVVDASGRVVGDETEERIREAVKNHLTRLAERNGGWTILCVDESNQSYWELTFPQGELHGGGPAKLTRIVAEDMLKLCPGVKRQKN